MLEYQLDWIKNVDFLLMDTFYPSSDLTKSVGKIQNFQDFCQNWKGFSRKGTYVVCEMYFSWKLKLTFPEAGGSAGPLGKRDGTGSKMF